MRFKEHLLERRLSRVPKELLILFWEHHIDFSGCKSQNEIVKKIIVEYQIKKDNSEFKSMFKDFLRDTVLTARESDYLISLPDPKSIIDWIKSWDDNQFIGQKHKFSLHTIVDLNQRFLEIEESKISFPVLSIFLVGSNQSNKDLLDGLEVISYHPTVEFEIIIREDLDILEIRGQYEVVKDFVSTAILDKHNPLSPAQSYFIGEAEDSKKSLVKPIRQIIKIDHLKKMLDGSYTKLSASFPGTKTSMLEATLEDLKDIMEETNSTANEVLKELIKNPVKGTISFYYNNKKYKFSVTKTGGLSFREYMPEEVVTYIIYKIKLSRDIHNGSQNV